MRTASTELTRRKNLHFGFHQDMFAIVTNLNMTMDFNFLCAGIKKVRHMCHVNDILLDNFEQYDQMYYIIGIGYFEDFVDNGWLHDLDGHKFDIEHSEDYLGTRLQHDQFDYRLDKEEPVGIRNWDALVPHIWHSI